MSGQGDALCAVPECKDGYVRVPVVVQRHHYGTTETFARMDDVQCDECGGLGRVPALPTQTTPATPSDTDKPTCGATIEGPIITDGGRSRPLWRDRCRRKVREAGWRCWQHGGPSNPAPTEARATRGEGS